MSYECQVIDQGAQPALAMRTTLPAVQLPEFLGKAYCSIAQYLAGLREQPAGPPFVAYYNMDLQNLEVEAGFPVSRALSGQGDIQATEIPGGKLASCLYVGPYSDCGPAYDALARWTKDHGYEPTGVAYEIYLNDPAETPPQELRTQIVFPLKSL